MIRVAPGTALSWCGVVHSIVMISPTSVVTEGYITYNFISTQNKMEWSAIESAYAMKQDERARDQVLTEQAASRSLDDLAANFVSDVMIDFQHVFTHTKTPGEFASSLFSILTKDDRGIIFGTILVIVSLSLLTLHDKSTTEA